MKIRCLYEGRFKLAEGPVWCDRTQSVWWVNMVDPSAIYRLRWGETEPQVFLAPRRVTGLALTEDDCVLAGSTRGLLRLDPGSGAFAPILRLGADRPGNRCNEIGVDPQGHLWVGTMTDNLAGAAVDPQAGALFRIAPDGEPRTILDCLGIPNTLVWDGANHLLTADSMTGLIQRFGLTSTGDLAGRAILHGPIDLGVPDGSALAVDGTLWNARWSAGCLVGIAPCGVEVGRISIPGGNVTSACFAGPALDVLVVTTSVWGLTDDDFIRFPQAGGLFAVEGAGKGTVSSRFAAQVGRWPVVALD
jgi:sugar lactone lactonase YvrE